MNKYYHVFSAIAEKHCLEYWLDSSSLYESLYNKNVNKNLNICINHLDEYTFLDLQYDLEQNGLAIYSFEGGYRILLSNALVNPVHDNNNYFNPLEPDIDHGSIGINVLVCVETGDKMLYRHNALNVKWNNHYHNIKDLYPLKKYSLNGICMLGPSNPIPYIKRVYQKKH